MKRLLLGTLCQARIAPRRYVLLLGVLLLGATLLLWWIVPRRLTPQESGLVGTWSFPSPAGDGARLTVLEPDRTVWLKWQDHQTGSITESELGGRWCVEDGALLTLWGHPADHLSFVRSTKERLGVKRRMIGREKLLLLRVTEDEMVLSGPQQAEVIWKRFPPREP